MPPLRILGLDPNRARTWVVAAGAALALGWAAGVAAWATLPAAVAGILRQAVSLHVGSILQGGGALALTPAWRAAAVMDVRVVALVWLGGLFPFGWAITGPVLFAEGFSQAFAMAALAAEAPRAAAAGVLPALVAAALVTGIGSVGLAASWRQLRARRGLASHPRVATYVALTLLLAVGAAAAAGLASLQVFGLAWVLRLLA